jgi:mono/diheme cytochrome c family protein
VIAIALLLAQSAAEPSMVARGQTVFAQNCSVGYCHGAGGAAGRGPRLRGRNLPKDYLDRVTREGIPSSAMPAWKGRLSEVDIRAVVEYVSMLSASTDAPPPMQPMPSGEGPATAQRFNGPPEAGRGFALFFDPARDHCGVCHSTSGRGIAIAPDPAEAVSKSPTDAIAVIRSTSARKVVRVKTKDGESFVALRASESKDTVKVYDLTSAPPVLRTLERSEIESIAADPSWRHNDFVQPYSAAELSDIVAYLRWAATGK